MEYSNLGNSELKVSRIVFGAWAIGGWMWGGADKKDALKAVDASIYNGITSLDTAPVYGFGQSEEIIGEAVKGKRDKVQILTKYGLNWDTTKGKFYFKSKNNQGKDVDIHKYAGKESVIQECEASLRRLKTDYIDLYQIHWHDETTPISETMEAIEQLLKEGKIRAAGVSNYTAEWLDSAKKTVDIASNQVPYSMINKGIEKELVPYCLENNVGILAYSPLQRGILTGKITPDYKFNEGDHRPGTPYYQKDNLILINDLLNKIKPIADSQGVSLTQLVIRWTLEQPRISAALVGARNPEQVEHNIRALDVKLPEEEILIINKELEDLFPKLNV